MRRSSIRAKLSLFLLIAILLPISASIFISYFYTKHSLKEEAIRENTNTVRQGVTSLTNQLNQMNSISLYVYNNIQEPTSLYNILLRGRSDFLVENNLYTGLHAIEQSAKDIQQVYIYSDLADQSYLLINGYLKRDTGRAGLEGHYVQPPNKDDPYIEPPHPSHNYGMEEFPYSPINTVITIHRPVYRAPLKERIGVLSIDFKLDSFRGIASMLYDRGHENVYLLDDTGTVVYASQENEIGGKPDDGWLLHARYALPMSGNFEWRESGFRGIVVYERFERIGRTWLVAKQIPYGYLYRDASRVLRINMLVLVSFLVVAIAAALYTSMRLMTPIKKLTESIKKIKLGKLKLDIDDGRQDEVGVLGSAIKNMVDTIDNLVMRELRLELANKDQQLKALQAQINPHFIYNALQSIGSVALHRQVPKIYELTSSLGLMMRYNMTAGESVVPLAKEIAHVDAYLGLQQQRFKEKLTYRIEADPAALRVRVPKMILQPLAENSFKHGFAEGLDRGEIEIAARREEGAVVVSVRDNGTGATPERLAELRRQISGKSGEDGGAMEEREAGDGGIGLMNVVSRIRLYYGEEAAVALDPAEPSGFRVTIRIPLKEEA